MGFSIVRQGEYMAPPACSIFSRTSDDDWFIFTDTFLDDGAVYIGERDFNDLAATVGYVSPQRWNRLLNAYKKVQKENDELRTSSARISGLGDSLRAILEAVESGNGPTTTEQSGAEQRLLELASGSGETAQGSSNGTVESSPDA